MRLLLLICCSVILISAEDIKNKKVFEEKVNLSSFTIGASISNFNSTSHETVYIPPGYASAGRKISELTWEAQNVKLLGVEASYSFANVIGLYAKYKKNITSGDGVMDDLDWISNAYPDLLTHWSHHNNTEVDNVSILDLGVNYTYLGMESTYGIETWVGLGYKQENLKFIASDGYGSYVGVPVSFNGRAITYKQEYKGPYIGVGAKFKKKNYFSNFAFKYSPKMSVEYSDRHHMREPPFIETTNFDKTTMMNFIVGFGYEINEHNTIGMTYEYTDYDYIRGDRTRTVDDGTVYLWTNSAAIDSKINLISLEYSYRF